MDTREYDAMEPKAPKAPSCSAREYAARFMPTVNYHDSKACKVQARRAAARRASIVRKRDVLAKVGEVDDWSLREDLIHSVLLPPHEAKSRGLDGGKWEDVYGPAAAWWAMEFWPSGDFRGYRREVDGVFIPWYYERNCPPHWYYESDGDSSEYSDDDDDDDSSDDSLDAHPVLCAIQWIVTEVCESLDFGRGCGWLSRAKMMQALRDKGVRFDEVDYPRPYRKYESRTPMTFQWYEPLPDRWYVPPA